MKNFFKYIITISLVLISLTAFSQSTNQIDILNRLDVKKQATFGDAVKLFSLQIDNRSGSFAADLAKLKSQGLIKNSYTEGKSLTKGNIALLTAKYIKLSDNLFYKVFGSERYAFRACVAAGIMKTDSSENDMVTGPQLIEILSKISQYKGEE